MRAADSVYYKVPFEDVPELVAGRRVLLRKGWAYVPREQVGDPPEESPLAYTNCLEAACKDPFALNVKYTVRLP